MRGRKVRISPEEVKKLGRRRKKNKNKPRRSHRAIDFLTSEEMLKYGDEEHLKRLQHELISKDWFQTLPDFNAYVVRKEQAMKDYAVNPEDWSRRTLINIAEAGFFSSDRTIAEYDQDIWHLGK